MTGDRCGQIPSILRKETLTKCKVCSFWAETQRTAITMRCLARTTVPSRGKGKRMDSSLSFVISAVRISPEGGLIEKCLKAGSASYRCTAAPGHPGMFTGRLLTSGRQYDRNVRPRPRRPVRIYCVQYARVNFRTDAAGTPRNTGGAGRGDRPGAGFKALVHRFQYGFPRAGKDILYSRHTSRAEAK